MNPKAHWESVYREKDSHEVSWYQPHPKRSLDLILSTGVSKEGHLIDVGSGDSALVDYLLEAGFRQLSVLDISAAALQRAQERLGERAKNVRWVEADITKAALPQHAYDLWHDRAVFHFLTDEDDRRDYVRVVKRALKPGGHIVVATFGPDGPTKCSGLDVKRYEPDELHGEFGEGFRLVRSVQEDHATPFGTTQQFIYCYCRYRHR